MSENLRDEIADSLRSFEPSEYAHHELLMKKWRRSAADAVLVVVGPELDRLRAEVERLTDLKDNYLGEYERAFDRATAAEAERDVLRARLAKVEALHRGTHLCGGAQWYTDSPNYRGSMAHVRPCPTLAALASVPEPSDSEPVEAWYETPGDAVYPEPEPITTKPSDTEPCGAQDWAHDDDGGLIIFGTCQKPLGHADRWHREDRDGELWAEWSGPADDRAPSGASEPDADREAGDG